jgi:class 3 adenylate cyclase
MLYAVSVSAVVPVVIIVVETAALATVAGLWLHERRRAALLDAKLRRAGSTWTSGGRATVKAILETAALVREKGVGGAIRGSIEELAGWAQVEQPDLRRLAARDGTVTIFFSDIEDSTALNDRLGDNAWLRVLDRHDQIVQHEVNEHDGHIIKSQGDGFMIAFALPADAMRCAIGMQRALTNGDRRLRASPVRVRIGIHTGVAVQRDGDLFGRNVALAARVAAHAEGGQILVTPEVSAAVDDNNEFSFTDAGIVELKGLTGDYHIQILRWQA